MGSPEKTIPATRFGESWKCRLTGGFHDELEGGGLRVGHGGAVGEFWWAAMQCGARDGESAAAELPAREKQGRGNGRVHLLGALPWRSCARLRLTSGARDGVRAPNVADVLTPVGHVDEDDIHSELRCSTDRATLTMINSQIVAN